MLIEIRHRTTYTYATAARYSIQSHRLTPPNFEGQTIVSWSIEAPGIENAVKFRDGYGNIVHLASFNAPHEGISIFASGIVETADTCGIYRAPPEPAPVRVYLRTTTTTAPDKAIREFARNICGKEMKDTLDGLHALMRAIREEIDYEIGSTHEHTSAAEALADGKGVCQDHAHVFISAARV